MPAPVTKIFYCESSSFNGSKFGTLTESIPTPVTTSTCGWNVGNNNPPLYCELNFGNEILRTSTQWQATPTQSRPTQNAGGSGRGNCWVAGPFSGEFQSGSWQITMSLAPVSSNDDHSGRLIFRVWKGNDISGSNASLISTTFFSSSVYPFVTAGVLVVGTSSFNLPNTIYINEYLFLQTYWSITVAGAGAGQNDDHDYIIGPSASLIITPPFIQDRPNFMRWTGTTDD